MVTDQPAREADQDRPKVIGRGHYGTVQMAEVPVSRRKFADIQSLIARPQALPAPV